jgi:cell shape-determining protein MreD
MNEKYLHITVICLICVFIIIAYGTYRCKNTTFVDPLTKSFFPYPVNQFLDGWGISHLLFFTMLGFLYPNAEYVLYSFVLGVIWELIEYSIKDHPFYLSKCKYNVGTENKNHWWYGRWQDIIMNSIGLLVGSIMARYFRTY